MYEMEGPQLATWPRLTDRSADHWVSRPHCQDWPPAADHGCLALPTRLRGSESVLTVNEFLLPWRQGAQEVPEKEFKIF